MKKVKQTVMKRIPVWVTCCLVLFLAGCKTINMLVKTNDIKQGDVVEVEVHASEKQDLVGLVYSVNDQSAAQGGSTPGQIDVPKTVNYNSAKTTGAYHTKLTLEGKATYQGGTTREFGPEDHDLTTSKNSREDNDLTFAIYIAHDNDNAENYRSEMANAFQDEISCMTESQYLWAAPSHYTTNAINAANSVDMVISLGHGNKHYFKAGDGDGDWVNTTQMEFGGFAPAGQTGDLEYLVFGSCQTLSRNDTANTLLSGGDGWGDGNYATSIAFGDVDGDGRDEVGVARKAGSNARVFLYNDGQGDSAAGSYQEIWHMGNNWSSSSYVTCIAFGNVDNDARAEMGIAVKSSSGSRFYIIDDKNQGFAVIHSGGSGWGSGNYTTSIAFGDVDGDGRDEVGITRKAGSNARYYILDDMTNNFALLHSGGDGWGDSNYATSIAFGDVDGDGRDEVGLTRKAGSNARYYILDDMNNNFTELHSGGDGWGDGNYATSIAFGNVDSDAAMEVGLTRKAGSHDRYYILDDQAHSFATLHSGGNGWGDGNYATSIAFGDVDNDGRDEVALGRKAGSNARFWVLEDALHGFGIIHRGGEDWGDSNYTQSVAFGNVNSNAKAELGVARKAGGNARYWVLAGYDDDPTHFGRGYPYYWFHNNHTKLNTRPFTGLHMVLGFRTNHRVVHWALDNDSADFFEDFADNLNDGMSVRGAWLEATDDELSFADGKNRTAVFYLKKYENDTISSTQDDHIYGNPEYGNVWEEYYE
jgi:Family of unknown function (DUF6345)